MRVIKYKLVFTLYSQLSPASNLFHISLSPTQISLVALIPGISSSRKKNIIKAQMKKEMHFLPKAKVPGAYTTLLQDADLENLPSGLGWHRCSVEKEITQAGERSEMLHGWFLLSQSPVNRLLFQPAPAPSVHPELGVAWDLEQLVAILLGPWGLDLTWCQESIFPFLIIEGLMLNLSLEKEFPG